MDTRTGTRQTLSTTGKSLKPRKYRSSCDACSASKVKCNQDTPQCLRCVNLGLRCNYSPSMRKGKPPASSRRLKIATCNSSSSESEHSNSNRSKRSTFSSPTFLGEQQTQPISTPECDNGLFHPTTIHTNNFVFWQDNVFPAFTNERPIEMETPLTATGLFDQNIQFITNSTPLIPTRDPMMFLEDPGLNPRKDPSQNPSYDACPQNIPTQCSPPMISSPKSISTTPSLCTHNLEYQGAYSLYCHPTNASIDQLLINNRSEIESAYALLSSSDSNNPQPALNIALICTKVLQVYEEIIKVFSNTCISPISGRRRSGSDAISITVGAYKMDAEDEERIRIQVVLIELRKVKGLVDAFSMKYCNGTKADESSGDEIYLALERFLRSKLSAALQDLVTRLEC